MSTCWLPLIYYCVAETDKVEEKEGEKEGRGEENEDDDFNEKAEQAVDSFLADIDLNEEDGPEEPPKEKEDPDFIPTPLIQTLKVFSQKSSVSIYAIRFTFRFV